MKDYNDFPPCKYFIRTLKNCPTCAFLYLQIWRKRGKNMSFVIKKKEIRKDYLISPTRFRNLLAPLMFLNLIDFIEYDERFRIDVLGSALNE